MFEPKFNFTLRIVNELSKIERLYGQISAEKLIPSLALQLATENQILATHFSTSIEGNPLSTLDVTNIILGDQIPTTKPDREVKNYFSVLTKLFDFERSKVAISTDLVRYLHKELMSGIETKDLGEFRDSGVFVGHKEKDQLVVKHNPPYHKKEEIETSLKELFDWLMRSDEIHPMLKAGIFHHEFVYIHPFYDGNGRLTRLITAYYLLLKKYEVARYFILDDYYDVDRQLYSDSLHTADNGDKTSWLEYFLEGIAFSLQSAEGRIEIMRKAGVEQVMGEKRVLVTPREEQVLEIIINKKAVKTSDIEAVLDVTRQQAHSLLFSLVKKGLVEKFGSTKTSYYKLLKK